MGVNVKCITYLVYIVIWESLIFGGAGYAVFVLERSPWFFLLAIIIGGSAYSPMKWIHGVDETKPSQ